MGELNSKLFTFNGKIKGNFDKSYLPTDEALNVKAGSQVMLLNNDREHRWVNGTVGKITAIKEDDDKKAVIEVKLEDGKTVNVKRHK